MQKHPTAEETTKDHEETSNKTLHEIEQDEKTSDSGNDDSSTPSPDGAFDEAGEKDKAGPM